jgi:hypothetical protein
LNTRRLHHWRLQLGQTKHLIALDLLAQGARVDLSLRRASGQQQSAGKRQLSTRDDNIQRAFHDKRLIKNRLHEAPVHTRATLAARDQ